MDLKDLVKVQVGGCHHNIYFAKNDLTKCEPYFQLFQNKPAVIRYKKPDELIEEMISLPAIKEKK